MAYAARLKAIGCGGIVSRALFYLARHWARGAGVSFTQPKSVVLGGCVGGVRLRRGGAARSLGTFTPPLVDCAPLGAGRGLAAAEKGEQDGGYCQKQAQRGCYSRDHLPDLIG